MIAAIGIEFFIGFIMGAGIVSVMWVIHAIMETIKRG
jgi:hypothetical protein